MTLLPTGVKIHVALGVTDMRKGFDGLAMLVQGPLKHDPFSGHLFVFRGRKVDLLKILFWDGTGLCLFTKRLESSRFFWSVADEPTSSVMLTTAQLSMLIEGHRLAIARAAMAPSCSWLMICGRLTRQWAIPMRRAVSRRSLGVWTSILLPYRMMLMPCIS